MIVLVGKSCSGKDSVAKILCSMGYSRVATCTTRPMRIGETDGVDYYFITQSEFMNMIEKGDLQNIENTKQKEEYGYMAVV